METVKAYFHFPGGTEENYEKGVDSGSPTFQSMSTSRTKT
jgi:hypothetical protein